MSCGVSLLSPRESGLCPICEGELLRQTWPLYGQELLHTRLDKSLPLNGAFALLGYSPQNVLHFLFHEFKYNKKRKIGAFLGHHLGIMLAESDWDIDLILPVPLHITRLRSRGYNQSMILAQQIQRHLGGQAVEGFVRTRNTKTQTQLSAAARKENVKDSFAVRKNAGLKGKSILIVDDIITTGATTSELIRTSLSAEPRAIYVCCVGLSIN